MTHDVDQLRVGIAKAVAARKIDGSAIDSIAKQLNFPVPIRGIDPCPYGICFDFFVDFKDVIELLKVGPLGPVKVFPWGFPEPDLFHVQIERDFAELPKGL